MAAGTTHQQHMDIIKKIYKYNDVHRNDYNYNRDLLLTGEASFEISQIGRGSAVDEYGMKFTHSNTVFFGTNAIRFNVLEDENQMVNNITNAYIIAEDSTIEERIAKIHVSTSYNLKSMSLVLELENGQTIYLNKDIDGETQDEVVRFTRLDSKRDQSGKILDIKIAGAN